MSSQQNACYFRDGWEFVVSREAYGWRMLLDEVPHDLLEEEMTVATESWSVSILLGESVAVPLGLEPPDWIAVEAPGRGWLQIALRAR